MSEHGPEEPEGVDIKKEITDSPQAGTTSLSCTCKCEDDYSEFGTEHLKTDVTKAEGIKTEGTTNLCGVLVKTEPVDCTSFQCDTCQYPATPANSSCPEGRTLLGKRSSEQSDSLAGSQSVESTVLHDSGQKVGQLDDNPHKCELCDYRTSKRGDLKVHIRTHTGERPYKCDMCSYSAKRSGDLTTHKRTHTGEKPYKCDICSYSAKDSSKLADHKRTHTGEKPHPCSFCDYRASQKSHLKRHLLTHTGEKRFSCDMCDFKTNRLESLQDHTRLHSGEKPHKCDLCEYSATRKRDMVAHKVSHSDLRPYGCEYCDYKGKIMGALIKHVRARHVPPHRKKEVFGNISSNKSGADD